MQSIQNNNQQQQPNDNDDVDVDDNNNNLQKELKHLHHRIQKLQEIIQLSSSTTALANPSVWQSNCLLAVRNCVNEWKHIVLFYNLYDNIDDNNIDDNNNIDNNIELDVIPLIKKSALNIFNLIQMSMQVGPLKGSNPGYFKRCGVQVAMMALEFLKDCVEDVESNNDIDDDNDNDIDDDNNDDNDKNNDDNNDNNNDYMISRDIGQHIEKENDTMNEYENKCNNSDHDDNNIIDSNDDHKSNCHDDYDHDYDDDYETNNNNNDNQNHNHQIILETDKLLLFTKRQHDIIHKWMINAEKAIKANKPPSKSALKLQQSSRSKKSQKKLKYQQKQLQQQSKKHKQKKKS